MKSDKFKSNSISLNIPIDIDEKITDLNLLIQMLKIGTKKYDSVKKIYSKLQDMYGTYFNCYINKCGEVAVFTIYLEFLKDSYIDKDISLWNEIIDFLYEVFCNPLIRDGSFNEVFLEIERENVRKNILSLYDSKSYYAYIRCEQISTQNEPYSNYIYGDVMILKHITGESLYKFYLKLKEMPYYFFIIGDFDETKVRYSIEEKFKKGITKKFYTNNNKFLKTYFVEESEQFDVSQTKLVINFKTPITIFNGDYYAFFVFNKILGGGYSKLYREIRVKRNLVYNINSHYEKFKGMLSIECGINDENFELTKDVILNEIDNISNGSVTQEDIDNAKSSIKRVLMSVQDKIISIHSFMVPLLIFEKEGRIDEFLREIKLVDRDRIIDSSKQIAKSAIFSVRPIKEN